MLNPGNVFFYQRCSFGDCIVHPLQFILTRVEFFNIHRSMIEMTFEYFVLY